MKYLVLGVAAALFGVGGAAGCAVEHQISKQRPANACIAAELEGSIRPAVIEVDPRVDMSQELLLACAWDPDSRRVRCLDFDRYILVELARKADEPDAEPTPDESQQIPK